MSRTSDTRNDEPDRGGPGSDDLAVYLNDHLAGSAAGLRLAKRCIDRERDTELGRQLEGLVEEIERDREILQDVMSRVDASQNPVKQAAANGAMLLTLVRNRLPFLGAGSGEISRLEEIELLSLGIEGKRLLWRALAALAKTDRRLKGFGFATLERKAQAQRDRLEAVRLELAAAAFAVRP
jgi:hypothetical protein